MWILLFALALGFKHAFDPDHLIAVSNFLARSRGLRETTRMSVSWALGHMATAAVIAVAIFVLLSDAMVSVLEYFEVAVAIMLIVLGALGILVETRFVHEHWHVHKKKPGEHSHFHLHIFGKDLHLHTHLLGVGIVHGLASNDELFILLVASLGVASIPVLLVSLGLFSIGVVFGMILFGSAVTYPTMRWGGESIRRYVTMGVGALSIIYGLFLLLGICGLL